VTTILVIEDSESQRGEIREALRSACLFDRIIEARDGIDGLRMMLAESPDLVLCDLEMPGLDGEKLLRMSRKDADAEHPTPFIVLTAVTDPARRAQLLQQGASDTISKPFHAAELIARVALHLELVRTQRELIQKNQELERLSRTDALTGLANRRQIDERLERECRRSQRYGSPFAIVLADIDDFKTFNDVHGHLVGDQVLVGVAGTMHDMVRDTDCIGRFGGEEFIVILSNNDRDGAEVFAERWRRSVERVRVPVEGGAIVSTTISIGIACWSPEIATPSPLLRRADEALYTAKAGGRNQVCVYSKVGAIKDEDSSESSS